MNSKKTKGKQKINIKRIEKDEDRLVTFSKRKNGIYTKLSELSILCGADVAFLVYSCSGKPYTFGSPSFRTVAERFLNGEASSSSLLRSVMDAHQRTCVKELCQVYNNLVEQKNVEETKRNTATTSAETLAVEENAWWKLDPTEMKDDEEVKQLMEKYEDLYAKLSAEVAARSHRNDAN